MSERINEFKDYFKRNKLISIIGEKETTEKWFSYIILLLLILSAFVFSLNTDVNTWQKVKFVLLLILIFSVLRLFVIGNSTLIYGKYKKLNRSVSNDMNTLELEIQELEKLYTSDDGYLRVLNFIERGTMTLMISIAMFGFAFSLTNALNGIFGIIDVYNKYQFLILNVEWDKWLGLSGFGFAIFSIQTASAKERISSRLLLLKNKQMEIEKAKNDNQQNYIQSLIERIWGRIDQKL